MLSRLVLPIASRVYDQLDVYWKRHHTHETISRLLVYAFLVGLIIAELAVRHWLPFENNIHNHFFAVELAFDEGARDCAHQELVDVTAVAIDWRLNDVGDLCFELVGGVSGVDEDRTTRGVPPEENALRTTEKFDGVEVEHVEDDARVDPDINAINERTHGRVNRADG